MSDPFIGEVMMFAGNFAPLGWADCNGQLLSINQNQALFSLLGTTYGGDGIQTFALPDLRGRTPVHAGSGPGMSTRTLGETGGSESVTLSAAQMPSHTHTLRAAAAASTGTPGSTVALAQTSGAKVYRAPSNPATMGNGLASAGGGQPHDNRQPYLGVRFIMALEGIYPSRN